MLIDSVINVEVKQYKDGPKSMIKPEYMYARYDTERSERFISLVNEHLNEFTKDIMKRFGDARSLYRLRIDLTNMDEDNNMLCDDSYYYED